MNEQMAEVLRRRGELLAEISMQRAQVAELGARWQPVFALADRGLAAVHFLRTHPVLAGGALALLLVRRRRMPGLLRGGWRVWRGYRYLKELATKLQARA